MDRPKVHLIRRRNPDGSRRWTLRWYDPETGRYRSKICGNDKKFAECCRVRLLRQLYAGASGDVKRVTWDEFSTEYVRSVRLNRSASYALDVERTLRIFGELCHPAGPHCVTYAMMERFKAARVVNNRRAKRSKPAKPLSAASVNKDVRTIAAALRKARQRHYVDDVPSFERIVETDREPDPLTDDEKRKIWKALPDDRWRTFIHLALTTGRRKMDILGVTWDRIDFDHGRIKFFEKKTHRERWLAISDTAVKLLRALYDEAPKVLCGDGHKPKASWVFTTPHGAHWKNNVNRQWSQILRQAGVRHHTIHALRATCFTNLAELGFNERVCQKLSGHSSIAVLAKHYQRVTDSVQQDAAQRLAAAAGA